MGIIEGLVACSAAIFIFADAEEFGATRMLGVDSGVKGFGSIAGLLRIIIVSLPVALITAALGEAVAERKKRNA